MVHSPADMTPGMPPSAMQLFTSFLRLGLTAFGGPSMIAYIRTMVVDRKGWLDKDTFQRGVALSQMIPGATAMQTAAYVGLKTRGVLGAAASFIGFGLPAFLLMLTFSAFYSQTRDLPVVVSAFSGLQAVIVAIVANATLAFGRTTMKDWRTQVIAGMAALLFGLKVSPVLVILLAALAGLTLFKQAQTPPVRPAPGRTPGRYGKTIILILAGSATGFLLLYHFRPDLFSLAALLFRIDLLAFGGGFASLPLMLYEIVEVRGWIDHETFMNGIVLGQVTPGPIVITATFIGYLVSGFAGGVVATVGIFLPSFLLLVGISPYFDRLRSSPAFNRVIGGVLCSFVGLLLTVTIRFALNVPWDLFHTILAAGSLAALMLKVDILWVVSAGTAISVIFFFLIL